MGTLANLFTVVKKDSKLDTVNNILTKRLTGRLELEKITTTRKRSPVDHRNGAPKCAHNEETDCIMLIEDAKIIESLWRIVSRLAGDSAMQKDLMQEALVRLWRLENEKPGRTRSWYLQNCRFHLQHWLALGRSLDSLKRANGDNRVVIDTVAYEEPLEGYDTNGELFDLVCAKDFVSTLSRHLKPRESAVLGRLADGMVLHDVALQLNLSYPTVLKYRRKIASLAIKLGIAPATSCHHTHGRRKIDDNETKSSATVNKINGTRQIGRASCRERV